MSLLETLIKNRRGKKYRQTKTELQRMLSILKSIERYPLSRADITKEAELYPYQFSEQVRFMMGKGFIALDGEKYGITVRGRLFLELLL